VNRLRDAFGVRSDEGSDDATGMGWGAGYALLDRDSCDNTCGAGRGGEEEGMWSLARERESDCVEFALEEDSLRVDWCMRGDELREEDEELARETERDPGADVRTFASCILLGSLL